MTKIQERTQCDGPSVPTARQLMVMLSTLPWHVEIRAISVRGQGGGVAIEYMHEGQDLVTEWEADGFTPDTNELKWKSIHTSTA